MNNDLARSLILNYKLKQIVFCELKIFKAKIFKVEILKAKRESRNSKFMKRTAKIELFKEYLKFSVGHFTIFSATERERLHGHNYRVKATFEAEVGDNGLTVDYNILKNKVSELCDSLDEYFIIPTKSPHLRIKELADEKIQIQHNQDELIFYKKDIKLLPIANTSVEDLSWYLLEELKKDSTLIEECKIHSLEIGIGSGDGQFGYSNWRRSEQDLED